VTLETTKHSFKDLLAQNQAAKHNSDLTNLAHALESVEAQIIELERIKRNIEAMAADIEGGKVLGVDEVHKLYNEATRAGRCL